LAFFARCNINDFTLRKFYWTFTYLILCLVFVGCNNNAHDIDIESVEINVEVDRFDKKLFKQPVEQTINQYKSYNSYFFKIFTEEIIAVGEVSSPNLSQNLYSFVNDAEVFKIYNDVQIEFEDLEPQINEITEALRYYNYHFPNKITPNLITYISGFNYGVLALDSNIAIGLDMFLGKDYPYYVNLQFPLYKREKLEKRKMPFAAIEGWLKSEFQLEVQNQSCLSKMVSTGKILYAMDAMFPFGADSMKINYSPRQMQWANENQIAVWTYLIDNNLLYNKNYGETFKLFNDGPFTSMFKLGSAPRIGEYMGWQIIRSFMQNNPDVSLSELMKIEDEQYILVKSNFKPKK
jgi:hypothetical protein